MIKDHEEINSNKKLKKASISLKLLTNSSLKLTKRGSSLFFQNPTNQQILLDILEKPPRVRTQYQIAQIQNFMTDFEFFKSIEQNISTLQIICQNIKYQKRKQGQYLFKQNDQGREYFFILDGQVEIRINDPNLSKGYRVVNQLSKFQSFGELALLGNYKRTASIYCLTDCHFGYIDSAIFQRKMNAQQDIEIAEALIFFQTMPLFRNMHPAVRKVIFQSQKQVRYPINQYVFKEGDVLNQIYIIKQGEFLMEKKLVKNNQKDQYVNQKDLIEKNFQSEINKLKRQSSKKQAFLDKVFKQSLKILTKGEIVDTYVQDKDVSEKQFIQNIQNYSYINNMLSKSKHSINQDQQLSYQVNFSLRCLSSEATMIQIPYSVFKTKIMQSLNLENLIQEKKDNLHHNIQRINFTNSITDINDFIKSGINYEDFKIFSSLNHFEILEYDDSQNKLVNKQISKLKKQLKEFKNSSLEYYQDLDKQQQRQQLKDKLQGIQDEFDNILRNQDPYNGRQDEVSPFINNNNNQDFKQNQKDQQKQEISQYIKELQIQNPKSNHIGSIIQKKTMDMLKTPPKKLVR